LQVVSWDIRILDLIAMHVDMISMQIHERRPINTHLPEIPNCDYKVKTYAIRNVTITQ